MAEVKILVEGYTVEDSKRRGKEETRPTITLVKDNKITMIVDPGVLENQRILVERLREEGLEVDDIDVVCITHSHVDH
jgi:glyoxylase-like metal-dependent hydrolase (beta-lactamase superfamily II)